MNPFKSSLRSVGVLITLVAGVLQYVFWFVAWTMAFGRLFAGPTVVSHVSDSQKSFPSRSSLDEFDDGL